MFNKLTAILNEDLVKTSSSPKPLIPRVLERDRLLIVEDGIGSIANSICVDNVVCGKLDVFGKKESLSTTSFLDNFYIREKSRARNRATCIQICTRLRKESGFANKSSAITRRNSIAVEVFSVSVTSRNSEALVINPVHCGKIIFVQNIVSIKDKEGFVT